MFNPQHSASLRLVGRVFTFDERLHYVLSVDESALFAQVSTRRGEETQIIDMPVSEVALRLTGYLNSQ